ISMTTCSTLLAMGMMPLCLLIYTKIWTDYDSILIPYDSIGTSLVALVVPVSVGIFVKNRWPAKAKIILKFGSITGAILIVLIAVVGGILYKGSWTITPQLWIVGTIFPAAGYSLGFFLARLAGQPWHSIFQLTFAGLILGGYQLHKKYFADRKKDFSDEESESTSLPAPMYSTMNGGFKSEEEDAGTHVSAVANGKI
ncbi:UNVERIFIED_CONTAM: hypothetical protein K2H54_036065, partial [Gekko kuhli]